MSISSLYVPDHVLQGEELPAHIMWKETPLSRIEIWLPEGIQVKEVYNVPEAALRISDEGHVIITDTEVDGYVGMVFETTQMEDPHIVTHLRFKAYSPNSQTPDEILREITMFRPLLEVAKSPSEIRIGRSGRHGHPRIQGQIALRNVGHGTALVGVEIVEDDEIVVEPPPGLKDFAKGFVQDFKGRMDTIAENFPEYAGLLGNYQDTIGNPVQYIGLDKESVQKWARQLEQAMLENEDFRDSLIEALITSYYKNVTFITEIASFMNYLQSMSLSRIIVVNGMHVANIPQGTREMHVRLVQTDMGFNDYEPVEVGPIEITSEEETSIPIYMLLEPEPEVKNAKKKKRARR